MTNAEEIPDPDYACAVHDDDHLGRHCPDTAVAVTVPHRARVTAAIHAFAEYLAEHPEIPTPTNLMSIAHLSERDEADEATRVAAVMSFCKGQDLEFKERHDFVTSAFQVVMHERTHGVRITHSVMTPIVPIVPVGHYVP